VAGTPELLLASKRCSQCLTTRDRIVPGERAARIVRSCRDERNHFFCHKGGDQKVHCRGVHDIVGGSRTHDFAHAFDIPIREVDPDDLDPDARTAAPETEEPR
jgi:hypothetical protein